MKHRPSGAFFFFYSISSIDSSTVHVQLPNTRYGSNTCILCVRDIRTIEAINTRPKMPAQSGPSMMHEMTVMEIAITAVKK